MVDKACQLCGFTYPPRCIYVAGPLELCGICVDHVLHDDSSPLRSNIAVLEAKAFLRTMRHWLNTPAGGLCVYRNLTRMQLNQKPEEGVIEMITCEVIGCYVNVFTARVVNADTGRKAYSICALVDKKDTKGIAELKDAMQKAVQVGIEKGRFPKAAVPLLKMPLRDGDQEVAAGTRGPEFAGKMFFNCNRYEEQGAPGVVDKTAKPILDQDEVYSGAIYRLDVNFYPFNTKGNKGVAVGLNNLMKVADGERLDGRMKAEDAFSKYADLPEPGKGGDDPFEDDVPY